MIIDIIITTTTILILIRIAIIQVAIRAIQAVVAVRIKKPKRLQYGDTIGIISPSSPVAAFCPRRLQRAVTYLEQRGFRVKLGAHATAVDGHTAGTVDQRLADFHQLWADDDVAAIITTIGGFNSHQLLEKLDYDLIAARPKILCGFSDITALLTAIYAKTGVVTFLGPAILPQFGEFGGAHRFTWQSFERTVMQTEAIGPIPVSEAWTDELLWWDKEDTRLRHLQRNDGVRLFRYGQGRGRVLAVNVGTLLLLAGTSYWPSFHDVILWIEDDPDEVPATIDRYVTQLRHLGVLADIQGLIIGRFHSKVPFTEASSLQRIIEQATAGYSFPIVADVDFGHTDPLLTVPNGVMMRLEANEDGATIVIEESAVSE